VLLLIHKREAYISPFHQHRNICSKYNFFSLLMGKYSTTQVTSQVGPNINGVHYPEDELENEPEGTQVKLEKKLEGIQVDS
jgi:hypothetical protein